MPDKDPSYYLKEKEMTIREAPAILEDVRVGVIRPNMKGQSRYTLPTESQIISHAKGASKVTKKREFDKIQHDLSSNTQQRAINSLHLTRTIEASKVRNQAEADLDHYASHFKNVKTHFHHGSGSCKGGPSAQGALNTILTKKVASKKRVALID